jgi:hypothetical protein
MTLLRTGTVILAVAAVGLLAATMGILTPAPDLDSKNGRHLLAGGLANVALSAVLFLIAVVPVRRGERWGLLAYAATLVLYGLPILLVDATHVAPERLVRTLAPQVAGLFVMTVGMVLVALSRKEKP